MLKTLFTLIFSALLFVGYGQIYKCSDASIKFTSEAPLEMIKAESKKAVGAINFATKNVAFFVSIRTFEGFNSGLQKEHFLENYMEATKYSKATFKGKLIEDIDPSKDGSHMVRVKGTLDIHGVEKEKIIKVKLNIKGGEITATSDFDVPLSDHDIKIPRIVNQKIASVISVMISSKLKPGK